jgi:hypothetical protein
MKVGIATLVLLSATTLCHAKDKTCTAPEPLKDSKFRPGQVWSYKTRPGEEDSFLTILRVEQLPKLGTIIHVRVDKICLRNCTGGPEPDTIQHMPFTRDAIERSVTKLEKERAEVPDYQEGYNEWRNACGGVYTIAVDQAIAVNEATFTKGLGCSPAKSSE